MFPLKDDNPTVRLPFVTFTLIVINVAVMIWLASLSPVAQQEAVIEHGFVPARIAQLTDSKLVVKVPIYEEVAGGNLGAGPQLRKIKELELPARPVAILGSLLSTMFLHGGWMHLIGNMWFLWIFGNNVEDRLGPLLYLGFYLVGGLMATACHWVHDPGSTLPVVGASGAVAVILGAYAVTFPKAAVRTVIFYGVIAVVDIPALVWLVIWLGGQLVDAFFNKDLGVAVWAHIGGFAVGAALMPFLAIGAPPPGTRWEDEMKKQFSFETPER